MGDDTHAAIDRLFDFVDSGADTIDRLINGGKRSPAHLPTTQKRRMKVINAEAVPKASKPKTPVSTAIAHRPHFYIVESVAGGTTRFIVTDGGKARTECSSREFAEKILRALETP